MLAKDATILVVDDMKMVRTSVIRYLTALGYENFVQASNGAEAITRVKEDKIDFVFMDVIMPFMEGNEALKKIREFNAKVPVVMLTSIADDDTIDECKKCGILGYLLKPLDADQGPGKLSSMLQKVN